MTILIAESEGFSPLAVRRLRERATVITADLDRPGLLAGVASADVLWVRLRHQIDAEVMDAGPGLRVIVTNTTGLTHIDLEAAKARNIRVVSLRGEVDFLKTIRATAELTLALALALVRHVPAAAAHAAAGGWNRYDFKGHDLFEKTVGIVGLGRLGHIVAGYFRAMGVHVLATDTAVVEADGITMVPLDELLSRSDLVTVHVDLNPTSRSLVSAREFAQMRKGSWFINTARGEVVDEPALLAALDSGHLAGAALDVLAGEPVSVGPAHPLVRYAATRNNLILTPHIGGYTWESLARTEIHLADVLGRMLDADAPSASGRPH